MKKLFSMLLALALAAGLMATALAEATPPTADTGTTGEAADGAQDDADDSQSFGDGDDSAEIPTTYTKAQRASDGTVTIDNLYTIACPPALLSIDIEDQDVADGLLFSAYSDTMGMDLYKYPAGDDTLEILYDAYQQDDQMNEVTLAEVNGIKVLVYRIDETGINATLEDGNGSMYDIMFTYQTSEEYEKVGQMIGSIKKIA